MGTDIAFGALTLAALLLAGWQWLEGLLFPLHRRIRRRNYAPPVTVLKPLMGANEHTRVCLESWMVQNYPGPMEIIFLVDREDDPVCQVVRELMAAHPDVDASLAVCPEPLGPNAKVSKLAEGERRARHSLLVVSDADVRAAPDLLINLVARFHHESAGLVACLYRVADPVGLAQQCEAAAVNSDFWTGVLQARRLGGLRFALGAAIAVRKAALEKIGGFASLADLLADDFWLGRRIFEAGYGVSLCPVVVDCRHPQQSWKETWRRQLRWARTIRANMPAGYFAAIVSNLTLWPTLWNLVAPDPLSVSCLAGALLVRIATALDNQRRLNQSWAHLPWFWMPPLKDLCQALLWIAAFTGNRVEWGGRRFRVDRRGRLIPIPSR